jgi:hypothetical protein
MFRVSISYCCALEVHLLLEETEKFLGCLTTVLHLT